MPIESVSIHPRNHGRTKHEKRNTRGVKNKDIIRAKLVRMEEHVDRHPSDNATRAHIQKKQALL